MRVWYPSRGLSEPRSRRHEHTRLIIESALDAVIVADADGRIIEWNPQAERTFGWTRAQIIGASVAETVVPLRHRDAYRRGLQGLVAGSDEAIVDKRVEMTALHRDGHEFPVEVSVTRLHLDGAQVFSAFVRDITGRKASAERIRRLNRWFAVLSGINSLIMRARDRNELLRGACRVAVEAGALSMAWIGLVDPQSGDLDIVASYGGEEDDHDVAALADQACYAFAQWPEFRALHDGQPVVCNDVEKEGSLSPFREPLLRHGHRSLACLPLSRNDWPEAVMVLFSDAAGFFDEEQSQRLFDLSANISFALVHMEKEQELEASELRFRQLAENIREVFWLTDPAKTKMLYVSPRYEEIWGRTCESLYASPRQWIAAIHPDDRERVVEAAENEQAIGRYDEEFRIVRPDGSIRWIRDRAFPVLRNGTEVYRITGIAEDITARKQAAQELHENERQLSDMLANVAMVSMILDRSARITYCNDYLLHLTGWRREEVMGKDWIELFIPPETELRGVFATLLDNDPRAWHHENEILTRSGERRLIRWHNSVRRAADGEIVGTASIGEDITEQKLAELQILSLNANLEQRVADRTADLERARAEADQANAAKSDFLARISHELRTPMHAVISFAKIGLDRSQTGDTSKVVDYFAKIHASGQRLLGLLNDLLDLSKMQAGQMVLDLEPVDLVSLTEQCLDDLRPLAAAKGLELAADSTVPGLTARVDRMRLTQVLTNLLSNAIKFSDPGQSINVYLHEATLPSQQELVSAAVIEVVDKGVGVPPEELETIFESFVQSTRTRTGGGGTGLGLPICREIVHAHGGSIFARPNPGGGTRFITALPLQGPLDAH